MSMEEPFMPGDEPAPAPDPREHDVDEDADCDRDVDDEPAVDDPDADRAAERQFEHTEGGPFRTPVAGDRLTAEQLETDLGDEPEQPAR